MIIEEYVSGSVTFRNGTSVPLSDSTVISVSVKKQCCPDGKFEIGGVYAASLSMTCQIPGTNSFSLRGAKIALNSKFQNEANFQPRGIFWVTDAKKLSGDIYSITGIDAVGWLDSSSMNYTDEQNRIFDSVAKYFESQGYGRTLNGWCSDITSFVNRLVASMTGMENVLSWTNYDSSYNGDYHNRYIYNQAGTNLGDALFWLSTEADSGITDCPRDLFTHLARLAGGFICARPDGSFTLRQFAQRDLGTAEITENCIEADSCEIADFTIQVLSVAVQSEILSGAADMAVWTAFSSYAALSPLRIHIHSNPFLDGFTAAYCRGDYSRKTENLWTIADSLFYLVSSSIRPFHCKVHKTERFEPGEKIRILPPGGTDFLESIITSVTWTFRGGCELSCSGEDSRTMSDALRMSKADKAIKEAQNRCSALEKKKADKPSS